MISLIKKDLILMRFWEYIILVSIIVVFYFIPDMIFAIVFTTLTITFFFYDHYYKMNRHIHSLPVNNSSIVMSRYISLYAIGIAILAFQYIIMRFFSLFKADVYLYTLIDLFILICLVTIFISIVIPVYQFFKSFYRASLVLLGLFIIAGMRLGYLSVITTIEESSDPDVLWISTTELLSLLEVSKLYVTAEYLTIIGVSTLGLLIVSYSLSVYISKRKAIV